MASKHPVGAAGQQGPQVRSDCWIEVEPRQSGGLDISLQSKVAGMYGQSIEGLVGEGCRVMGLDHARVTVVDQGALPFVDRKSVV